MKKETLWTRIVYWYHFGRRNTWYYEAWWWVLHRVHPKHRYHVLKTGLPPGYHDPDKQLKYAMFTTVCSHLKEHKEIIDINQSSEKSKAAFAALELVRVYWEETRVEIVKGIDSMWDLDDPILHKKALEAEEMLKEADRKYLFLIVENLDYMWC